MLERFACTTLVVAIGALAPALAGSTVDHWGDDKLHSMTYDQAKEYVERAYTSEIYFPVAIAAAALTNCGRKADGLHLGWEMIAYAGHAGIDKSLVEAEYKDEQDRVGEDTGSCDQTKTDHDVTVAREMIHRVFVLICGQIQNGD